MVHAHVAKRSKWAMRVPVEAERVVRPCLLRHRACTEVARELHRLGCQQPHLHAHLRSTPQRASMLWRSEQWPRCTAEPKQRHERDRFGSIQMRKCTGAAAAQSCSRAASASVWGSISVPQLSWLGAAAAKWDWPVRSGTSRRRARPAQRATCGSLWTTRRRGEAHASCRTSAAASARVLSPVCVCTLDRRQVQVA
jgi:hypothetical protein